MQLQILYSNDLHNQGQPCLARVAQLKRPDSLILDGGDALRGSNTVFRLEEPIVAQMRRLGYRAQAMGNREFHYLRRVQRWREQERGFPLLAANLEDLRNPYGPWQDYSIQECSLGESRIRVGLLGLTPVQYPVGSAWEKLTGFRFHPPEATLRRWLPFLESRCHSVVVMSHLGLPEDRRLAPLFPKLRLILGAHSHDVLEQPERIGACHIVQGGSHGRFLGEILLKYDSPPSDWRDLEWKLH